MGFECFVCYRAEGNRLRPRPVDAAACGATIGNPRPRPAKGVVNRAALLAELAVRRRRAQILARHALEAPAPARAVVALAS